MSQSPEPFKSAGCSRSHTPHMTMHTQISSNNIHRYTMLT